VEGEGRAMRNHQVSEEDFLNRVKAHQMTVFHDDGVYRHLRFNAPGTMNCYFDIVTFPGRLCYVGDMGAFTFTRLHDMFDFFRTDARENRGDKKININTGYWAEKAEAIDKTDGLEEFDEDRFRQVINEYRLEWIKDGARNGTLTKEERRELWEAVDDEVLRCLDEGEIRSFDVATDFSHKVGRKTYEFTDLWDHHFKRYSYRFIWCCYAIAWGIQQYDKVKETPEYKMDRDDEVLRQAQVVGSKANAILVGRGSES
jgi:hypothetical protein